MNILAFAAIIASAGCDIAANIQLAKSDGFNNKKYGLMALVFIVLAFTFLSFAVKTISLAIAYTMWGALGVLGTSLGGWVIFKQKLSLSAWCGISLIIAGMVIMHFK